VKSHHHAIRTLLRSKPDGLTTKEITDELKLSRFTVQFAVKNMPDAYIDRWLRTPSSPLQAVWCVVVPPENCPKPESKLK
jgi:hypothetical protein